MWESHVRGCQLPTWLWVNAQATPSRQAAGDVRILIHVRAVVHVDEVVSGCLAEDGNDGNDQQKGDGGHDPRIGLILRWKRGFCRADGLLVGAEHGRHSSRQGGVTLDFRPMAVALFPTVGSEGDIPPPTFPHSSVFREGMEGRPAVAGETASETNHLSRGWKWLFTLEAPIPHPSSNCHWGQPAFLLQSLPTQGLRLVLPSSASSYRTGGNPC